MMNEAVRPLTTGDPVAEFTVERVIAQDADGIIYGVRDTQSGVAYLLREYAPAGVARRLSAGGIVAAAGQDGALTRGVAGFLADAARIAAMRHDGLARGIRAWRENGTAYQLFALPPGRSLADRLAGGSALTAHEAAPVARALLEALEFLHAHQRLHGRIDPAHVLIPDAGGAMLLGGAVPPAAADGHGTTADDDPYAPPEQVEAAGPVGPWTDIYRLAATLYHCLAGVPPPPAQARRAAAASGDADALVLADREAGRGTVDAELHTLVRRGLRLDPDVRPQSLREWRARIAEIGAGPAPGPAAHAGPARPPWWAVLLGGLALAVLLVAGVYLLTVERNRANAPTAEVQAPSVSAEEMERWRQALKADAVVGYRQFIADFPDSPRVAQAHEYIDRLEDEAWAKVLEENTRAAFEAHLETFPDGRHATEARARIEAFRQVEARRARADAERRRQDDAAWQAARSAGTIAALDGYLADWPGGAHADMARTLRQRLQAERNDTSRFEQARAADTIAAYRGYIDDYPAGRHVEAALEAIDRLTLRPGKTFRDCSGCPQMVVVPAGSFWQGSADTSLLAVSLEKPRRRVVIGAPFAISTHEITMRQWDACVADGGCERQPGDNGWGRGRRPVIDVSWDDAVQYTEWLSDSTGQQYRLPSESEWEYAARAGEEGDWLGGSAAGICAYGNVAGAETGFEWRHPDCADRVAASTAIVGSFESNAFGLYDVIGNVAEWTMDCMNLSYLEAPTDGSAWSRGLCSSRMTRGGSWFSGTRDIRLPARFNLKTGDRNDFTGFRVVRRVEPQPGEGE